MSSKSLEIDSKMLKDEKNQELLKKLKSKVENMSFVKASPTFFTETIENEKL